MKKYYSRLRMNLISLVLILITLGVMPCSKAEETVNEKNSENLISFSFQDTDIDLVLKFFSEVAGLTIIKGDKVRGRVTVISSVKLPVDEALDVFQAILEVKGFTMIRSGKVIKVVAQVEATKKRVETRIGRQGEAIKSEDKVVTQIIPLEYVAASDIKAALGGLIFPGGNIIANERTNTLVITDVASNIERLVKIIDQLDVAVREENIVIEIIPLEYADETRLANMLKQVFGQRKTKVRQPQKKGNLPLISKEVLRGIMGEVTIIPDERLHSLIVITAEPNLGVVKKLTYKLDQKSPPSADNIRIFRLQNGKAEEVASVLNELFSAVAAKRKNNIGIKRAIHEEKKTNKTKISVSPQRRFLEGNVGGLEGEVKVVADKRTNSLIITTSPQNFPTIERLLKKLDVRSAQVLIKALIAEISLTDETKFGIEWSYTEPWTGRDSHKVTATASTTWDLSNFISEGFKYSILRKNEELSAVLQSLAKNTEFNILSAPCVLASDNEEAKIKVGESIPILKDVSYTETSGTVKSYDYKDVAIELTVTPSINKNRDVSLAIHQLINKISGYDSELNAPILATRESQTTVVVKDKQTIIIGGLMRNDKIKTLSKIPLLGDIPLLGLLFRKHHDTTKKTELVVFITPYVVVNSEEAKAMTEEEVRKSEKIYLRLKKDKVELKGLQLEDEQQKAPLESKKQLLTGQAEDKGPIRKQEAASNGASPIRKQEAASNGAGRGQNKKEHKAQGIR